MTPLNAESQSCFLTGTRPAGTDEPGRGQRPDLWRTFLIALLRALSAWTV
jgi:hypothetical protein